MPGVFGTASCSYLGEELLRAMAATLGQDGGFEEVLHRDGDEAAGSGQFALGLVGRNVKHRSVIYGDVVGSLDGELYDTDKVCHEFKGNGHVVNQANHAAVLIAGFESSRLPFLRDLHGKFSAAIWDSRRQKLVLMSDRFGMKPLYYVHLPGRLLFASEIKALLADPEVPHQPSLRGIAQFFTYGQLFGEDTLIDGVRVLPAATCLTYDPREDRLTLERYWRLTDQSAGMTDNREAILDRIDHAFGESVRRCTQGVPNLGLSLSGGLDSRTILGAMDDDQPITTVSMGVPGSADHRAAVELARLTNRQHHQCMLGDGFLQNFEGHLRQMVRLTDGHYLSQCIVMPTLPIYRELGIQVLLRGHAGELMHMRKAYNFSLDAQALAICDEKGLESWLTQHLQAYLLEGAGTNLFAARHRTQIPELARQSLQDCLREAEGTSAPAQRIWQLFLSQRLRRETAMSMVKFGSIVETRLPLLDNELIDALYAAPIELKLDETIQSHILRRRRPAFLCVLNVNTGARMNAGRWGQFAGKVQQKVFAKLRVPGYQPYEHLGRWLRRELKPLVQRLLLTDECLDRGLFDPNGLRQVVESHFAGKNHTFLLLALMTYEIGQRELLAAKEMTPALPAA